MERLLLKIAAVNALGEGNLSEAPNAIPNIEPISPSVLLQWPVIPKWNYTGLLQPVMWDGNFKLNLYWGLTSDTINTLITLGNVTSYTHTDRINGQIYFYKNYRSQCYGRRSSLRLHRMPSQILNQSHRLLSM